jgi:hypothetical protein
MEVDMPNRVVVGWVWEAVPGEFMKYWIIKAVDKTTGIVKLTNIAKPSIKTERELDFVKSFGKTRQRTVQDKVLRKDNPYGGR